MEIAALENVSMVKSRLRVGSVSFLNAKPLIYGLDEDDAVDLKLDVPSRLLDGLRTRRFDVALLPVIDYQRLDGLRLLTCGGIGCDGPTLTVRLFSRRPFNQTRLVAADTDSHTSVALAEVIFAERYGLRPRFVDQTYDRPDAAVADDAVRLLIGDKVVCEEPRGFEHQLDLGEAWKSLTGLPFVFACWMARDGVAIGDLSTHLEQAKQQGLAHVNELIAQHAVPRGWPVDVARQYLLDYLKFDITPAGITAIERFHQLAHRHGVLAEPPQPLRFAGST